MHNDRMIESFSDLLANWTTKELVEALGVNYQTAASMKRREAVGVHHWAKLIEAASLKGLTLDDAALRRLWQGRRSPAETDADAA